MTSRFPRPLACLVAVLFLSAVPVASAGPGEGDHSVYEATPGDPLVLEDAEVCLGIVGERDGTSCNVLYGHIFDLLNKVPINVQRPPDGAEDLQRGFAAPVGWEGHWDLNQLTLFSSPGFVEYPAPGEPPRLHPEKGITKDVRIPTDVPILGYWYLSADLDEQFGVDDVPGQEGPDVGAMPCLTVRMTLQTGRYYQQGDVLAVGETTKTVVSAAQADQLPTAGGDPIVTDAPCTGGRTSDVMMPERATEFEVELVPQADPMVIPADDGFLVHVEWYQHAPSNPDSKDKLYPSEYNLRTGRDHRARVVVPVEDAVAFEDLEVFPFNGLHYLRLVTNSPWGSYDIDQGSFQVEVLDPSGARVDLAHLGDLHVTGGWDHGEHFDPIIASFPWDLEAEALPPGEYTIRASVMNWQHTATAVQEVPLTVGEGDIQVAHVPVGPADPDAQEQDTPAPAVAPLVLLALVGAVLARRRDR